MAKGSSQARGATGGGDTAPLVLGVAVTHPERPLWPDGGDGRPIGKLELARYLEAVAPVMLAHIGGRPCSILRAPDGIAGESFFQRHPPPGLADRLTMVAVAGEEKPYFAIETATALVALAQFGAVEFHPWNSAPGRPEVPGRLVFDLDPAPDVAFAQVVEAALELRAALAGLGLVPFCKTTGGKGLHVVVPLRAPARGGPDWAAAKGFARGLCEKLAAERPERYLVNMRKNLRAGRIFLDYLRNDLTATAVAPLSPRARPGALVSMPLDWDAVTAELDPARFSIRTVPALLETTTAWADYDAAARPLAAAIARLAATPA